MSSLLSGSAQSVPAPRRGYIDWLRGLGVVIMIEAHTLDAWTIPAEKTSNAYWFAMLLGGMGAPVFLFLAGVSVALASGSLVRRGATVGEAAGRMIRRGFFIWMLALLFRVQSFVLSPGSMAYGILKVDILNIMGPAIAGAAAVWALGRRPATRGVLLGAVAVAFALMTPAVRASSWLVVLPDPLEWYLRPTPGRTNFTLLPWAGFVFGGAAVGVLLELARERDAEKRLIARLAIVGAAIGLASYAASFLPSLCGPSRFWTSSPAFFFIRVSVMIAALALAFLWEQRRGAARFSPLRQFGRTSLFIYWIHIEMVYGVLTRPIQQALPLWQSIIAYAIFTALMLAASLLKDRFAGWWTLRRKRSATPATIPAGGIT